MGLLITVLVKSEADSNNSQGSGLRHLVWSWPDTVALHLLESEAGMNGNFFIIILYYLTIHYMLRS